MEAGNPPASIFFEPGGGHEAAIPLHSFKFGS